jgi:hypothetical protein
MREFSPSTNPEMVASYRVFQEVVANTLRERGAEPTPLQSPDKGMRVSYEQLIDPADIPPSARALLDTVPPLPTAAVTSYKQHLADLSHGDDVRQTTANYTRVEVVPADGDLPLQHGMMRDTGVNYAVMDGVSGCDAAALLMVHESQYTVALTPGDGVAAMNIHDTHRLGNPELQETNAATIAELAQYIGGQHSGERS